MDARAQREMLGDFLRTRRSRVTAESVGLPPGRGRRVSGLRREEVADLAHVSTSWYTYLEQGRDVIPSPEVLDNLARALRLNPTEHRYLNSLAAGPLRVVAPTLDPTAGDAAVLRRLVRAADAIPLPVYAVDGRGTLLAWNKAMPQWYGQAYADPSCPVNMVQWLFTDPDARLRLADWPGDARDLINRIRYYFGLNRFDDAAERLVAGIRLADPLIDRWWNEHDVSEQESRQRLFNHPQCGVVALTMAVVRPTISPAASVVFHLAEESAEESLVPTASPGAPHDVVTSPTREPAARGRRESG